MIKNILCFGDSNTWGLIAGTTKRYPWGIRWTSILQERLHDEKKRIIEEGLCGRTTVFEDELRIGRKGTDILPVLLESHAPLDVIILMLGTNDCKTVYHATPHGIGTGIQCLLDQIRSYTPNSQILLVSPIYLADKVWECDSEFDEHSVKTAQNLKDIYQKIATYNRIEFLAASDYAYPGAVDREHLDKDGHEKLAEAIYQKLLQMKTGRETENRKQA